MNAETSGKAPGSRDRAMWIVTGAVALLGTLAVFSYTVPDRDQAASGAQLYDQAVTEALRGLQDSGERKPPPAAGRPALPAGLNPADHYWCDQCKAWHKKQAPGDPQAPQATPPTQRVLVPYAIGMAPGNHAPAAQPQPAAASTPPPLPEGLSPADYYWCAKCKAYHKRTNPAPANPAP